MIELLETAGVYAVVVVATVEALRSRIPSLDGRAVLVAAGAVSVVLSLLFADAFTGTALVQAARIAVLSWIMAVGGNAWMAKLAGRVGGPQ